MWQLFLPKLGDSTSQRIHQTYLQGLWRERGTIARIGLLLGVVLWSVPLHVAAIVWMTAINGRAISRIHKKSVVRLMLEQLQVGLRYNILAPWYFQFDLHDDHKRRRAGEYLHRSELKGGLYKLANRHLTHRKKNLLGDKSSFHDICIAAGLPTLTEIAIAQDGAVLNRSGSPVSLPFVDLFAKPVASRGGSGAQVWLYFGEESWQSATGERLSASGLIEHFSRLSRTQAILIQKRAVPHPTLSDLSNGALPTARLLTIKGEVDWEPVVGLLRMAIGANRMVDNFHAGGIAANIDFSTGVLGRATDIGLTPDIGWVDVHPDTGGTITGRVLPYWAETLKLASRAHSVFREQVVAGWDIAILAEGPVLVEGNAAADTDIHQRVSGLPLGSGKFGEMFLPLLLKAIEVAGNGPW
jgi:hypothetical protein